MHRYSARITSFLVSTAASGASALCPFAGGLATSSATGDETLFCPVPLPRKTESGAHQPAGKILPDLHFAAESSEDRHRCVVERASAARAAKLTVPVCQPLGS